MKPFKNGGITGGEIEVVESYFRGKRKGKRDRSTTGKIPVFGLLKRGGKLYTKIIPDARQRWSHFVENSKESYYLALRKTQGTIRTDNPNWQPWLMFFMQALPNNKNGGCLIKLSK